MLSPTQRFRYLSHPDEGHLEFKTWHVIRREDIIRSRDQFVALCGYRCPTDFADNFRANKPMAKKGTVCPVCAERRSQALSEAEGE